MHKKKKKNKKRKKAYCKSLEFLISISLPPDESPAFFKVSPTMIILDFSALLYPQQQQQKQQSLS
jgi:hypothetical protein